MISFEFTLIIQMNKENKEKQIEIIESKEQTWKFIDGGSIYMENFFDKETADKLYTEIKKELDYIPRGELKFGIYGKEIPLPRIKAMQGTLRKNGDYPIYRYGLTQYPETKPWTPIIKEIRDFIEEKYGENCTHLVANKYEDENDHIGYHHDKTTDMTKEGKIYVFSFGETRNLELAEVKGKSLSLEYKIPVKHGSLYILNRETNEKYKHRIKQETYSKEERVSLTFRPICTYVNRKDGKIYKYSKIK